MNNYKIPLKKTSLKLLQSMQYVHYDFQYELEVNRIFKKY